MSIKSEEIKFISIQNIDNSKIRNELSYKLQILRIDARNAPNYKIFLKKIKKIRFFENILLNFSDNDISPGHYSKNI